MTNGGVVVPIAGHVVFSLLNETVTLNNFDIALLGGEDIII